MTVTYLPVYVERVAQGMLRRYSTVQDAVKRCQQHIDSPHTEMAGKAFWTSVRAILEREGTNGFAGSPAHLVSAEREA